MGLRMGRKKVVLKRIEDKNSRHISFSKRWSGLMKNAREVSILCGAEVALFVISSGGKLYQFCSENSAGEILERRQRLFQEDLKTYKCHFDIENHHPKCVCQRSHGEIQELAQKLRQLEGPEIGQLSVPELVQLEEEFHAALTYTSCIKTQQMMESLMSLHEKGRMLREENKLLERESTAMENGEGRRDVSIGLSEHENNHLPACPQLTTLSLLP